MASSDSRHIQTGNSDTTMTKTNTNEDRHRRDTAREQAAATQPREASLAGSEFRDERTLETPIGPVTHDPSADAYRVVHDRASGRPLATTIVELVEVASGVSAKELPVLHDQIDPEALSDLFGPSESTQTQVTGQVVFRYADARVVVDADGTITVWQGGPKVN